MLTGKCALKAGREYNIDHIDKSFEFCSIP